jgi:hypothetical protein
MIPSKPPPRKADDPRPARQFYPVHGANIGNSLCLTFQEGLTLAEEAEWQLYETVEHLVRMAEAPAMAKLNAA